MQGKIIKGIAGFYYVHVVEFGIYECKAKGAFRKEKVKLLVGDNVEIDVLDEEKKLGNVVGLLPRENELIRPAVANIDQALVVFAITKPKPHFNLLDRFLVMMESKKIPIILCFNKKDIAEEKEIRELEEIYESCGYRIIFTSAKEEENIKFKKIPIILCFNKKDIAEEKEIRELEEIYESCGYRIIFTSAKEEENIKLVKEVLQGKTTAVAGPSGVGKSSLINLFQSAIQMETGSISEKIERGKHTTRHSELIPIDEESYIMDTPGFSSLYVNAFEKEELKYYFPEFEQYEGLCKFNGCDHIHEPNCAVKQAVEEGKIHRVRYENYMEMYKELQEKRRY